MNPSNSQTEENRPVGYIHRGMPVYDVNNEYVGKVEVIHRGVDVTANQNGLLPPENTPIADVPEVLPGSVIASNFTGDTRPHAVGQETPSGILADILAPDQFPREVAERLEHNGFLRIEGKGLFARDRYVTLDQIDSVAADRVLLRIARGDLIKA